MNLAEKVQNAGVVGAGGGGFPTHVKLAAKAEVVIANGAECEPLLHKDAVVMETRAARLVRGVQLAMQAVGAKQGVVGVKAKKKQAVEAVQAACAGTEVRVHLLGDYYPAGDEYDLVYSVTGRLIPPGGIPLNVGAVVDNVETLVNIAAAADGQPVVRKMVTIAGAVREPATMEVAVGTSLRACVEAAGGFATDEPVYAIGGLMMGETTEDLDRPVTKTTTGVVVLPRSHRLMERKLRKPAVQARIGKSACDQCRYCTEYCPRFLLGYAVEPHQVMRSLAFTGTGAAYWNQFAALCCSCGLCTLFACPEELYPKEACDDSKAAMRQAGVKWAGPKEVKVHPLRDGRRVPIKMLARRLDVLRYDVPAPLRSGPVEPARVVLPLRQGAGAPGQPLVGAGARVAAGQPLTATPAGQLGSIIHAPFAGTVAELTATHVSIKKG
jgi:Na+-translocating ferredoxin:NAD+ oxidoreductase RnfC subunit